jgi:hypothetical protein
MVAVEVPKCVAISGRLGKNMFMEMALMLANMIKVAMWGCVVRSKYRAFANCVIRICYASKLLVSREIIDNLQTLQICKNYFAGVCKFAQFYFASAASQCT